MKTIFKKLYYRLQLFDGLWSLPLSIIGFWIVGMLLTALFGYSVGTYDVGFIQPLFLAIAVLIGAANAALGFLYFFARGIFKWFYGRKDGAGKRIVDSVVDWQNLRPHQRFHIFFFVLFFMIGLIVIVYLSFI